MDNIVSKHAGGLAKDTALDRRDDGCFHGGAFFEAVGEGFDDLHRRHGVINADVLDAWFPPAPSVIETLTDHLPWLARTSPPTHSAGLLEAIGRVRGVPQECILPGAGSSDLIFLALREWLTPDSRVLMLDPSYGEYSHICEKVIGCHVDRIRLERPLGYRVDLDLLTERSKENYQLVVLINPNNPSGQHIERDDLERVLTQLPAGTRCWLDEAYVEYAGTDQSLEEFAAASSNVFVCKSLSKVYALSGMRAAYLVGNNEVVAQLRKLMPPWAVSLPAQVAAVRALEETEYYAARHLETHRLREQLIEGIEALCPEGKVISGVGNWVLWYPPSSAAVTASEIIRCCRSRGLFLRGFADAEREPGVDAVRISVKDAETQEHIVEVLAWALGQEQFLS
ncbi:MAG TPA: histidinol-phosphate aminotransferase family protein [Planctomycetes bacterium]|nr:histidinol-phosphate aminotransferase family protein [Planctomycetota bacterium]HIN79524.1 histidinol-phosphate aminotransferase family protein [Planctomycetota bacterium]